MIRKSSNSGADVQLKGVRCVVSPAFRAVVLASCAGAAAVVVSFGQSETAYAQSIVQLEPEFCENVRRPNYFTGCPEDDVLGPPAPLVDAEVCSDASPAKVAAGGPAALFRSRGPALVAANPLWGFLVLVPGDTAIVSPLAEAPNAESLTSALATRPLRDRVRVSIRDAAPAAEGLRFKLALPGRETLKRGGNRSGRASDAGGRRRRGLCGQHGV